MKEPRQLLKREAKERFRARYWPCVWVQAVLLLTSLAISWLTGQLVDLEAITRAVITDFEANAGQYLMYFLLTLLTGALFGAISIEASYFYLRMFRGEKVGLRDFFEGSVMDVGRKVGAYLWQALFLFLWGMAAATPLIIIVLLIPTSAAVWLTTCGVVVVVAVKGLAYSMMAYIIRDCPEVTVRESLRQSIALMKGNKGKLFVLGLSFLGWMLLTSAAAYLPHVLGRGWWLPLTIACSIASVLYVGPYIAITMAGFYHAIRRGGLKNRVIGEAELEGAE